jgi:hypothetical protein
MAFSMGTTNMSGTEEDNMNSGMIKKKKIESGGDALGEQSSSHAFPKRSEEILGLARSYEEMMMMSDLKDSVEVTVAPVVETEYCNDKAKYEEEGEKTDLKPDMFLLEVAMMSVGTPGVSVDMDGTDDDDDDDDDEGDDGGGDIGESGRSSVAGSVGSDTLGLKFDKDEDVELTGESLEGGGGAAGFSGYRAPAGGGGIISDESDQGPSSRTDSSLSHRSGSACEGQELLGTGVVAAAFGNAPTCKDFKF